MKEVTRHLLIMSFIMLAGIQIAGTEEDLDNSSEVKNYFYELFSNVGFGYDSTEAAGWILRREKGYRLVKWAFSDEKSMQVWNRGLPSGAVALAHTHPNKDIQRPSKHDIALAKRINIPVYTICRGGVWKATPDGVITKILPLNWFKEMKANKRLKAEIANQSVISRIMRNRFSSNDEKIVLFAGVYLSQSDSYSGFNIWSSERFNLQFE